MKKLLLLALLFCSTAYASDYHQNGQSHRIVYAVIDNSGKPVANQTVSVAIERSEDNQFYDFNDGTFKNTGWTTRVSTLSYDPVAENYFKTVAIDNGSILSGDVTIIISNDDAVYSDRQVDVINIDSVSNLIKIHR